MILYPAIDIRGGQAVRLVEGDFARERVFDADPVDAALRWAEAGAPWLHVVDLDGAREGRPMNTDAVRRIRDRLSIPLQLGGGLRTLTHMEEAIGLGIDRLVLGSVALSSPALVSNAIRHFGDRVAVALDARDGMLAANGWIDQTEMSAVEVARRLADSGVRTFIVTDIGRDGTLRGPNLDALSELVAAVDAAVIASGGVGTLDDLTAIRATGAAGAIIGRALYDGTIDLGEALAFAAKEAVA